MPGGSTSFSFPFIPVSPTYKKLSRSIYDQGLLPVSLIYRNFLTKLRWKTIIEEQNDRVLHLGLRGRCFEPQRRNCILSLSETFYPLLSIGSTQYDWKTVDWDVKKLIQKLLRIVVLEWLSLFHVKLYSNPISKWSAYKTRKNLHLNKADEQIL